MRIIKKGDKMSKTKTIALTTAAQAAWEKYAKLNPHQKKSATINDAIEKSLNLMSAEIAAAKFKPGTKCAHVLSESDVTVTDAHPRIARDTGTVMIQVNPVGWVDVDTLERLDGPEL